MDANELMSKLRAWYPDLSFRLDVNKLYVNNQKLCVVRNTLPELSDIDDSIVNFIRLQIKEVISDAPPVHDEYTEVNVSSIGTLKKAIATMPDNWSIVGNCVDMYGRWYNYPCYVAKVRGDNDMVTIQSKPINENMITECIDKFRKEAEIVAHKIYKKTGQDHKEFIVTEIMKLIGQ